MKTSEEIIIGIQQKIKDDRGHADYNDVESTITNVLKQNQYGKGYNPTSRVPEHNTLNLCVRFGLMKNVTDKRLQSGKPGFWVNEPYLKEFLYTWVLV